MVDASRIFGNMFFKVFFDRILLGILIQIILFSTIGGATQAALGSPPFNIKHRSRTLTLNNEHNIQKRNAPFGSAWRNGLHGANTNHRPGQSNSLPSIGSHGYHLANVKWNLLNHGNHLANGLHSALNHQHVGNHQTHNDNHRPSVGNHQPHNDNHRPHVGNGGNGLPHVGNHRPPPHTGNHGNNQHGASTDKEASHASSTTQLPSHSTTAVGVSDLKIPKLEIPNALMTVSDNYGSWWRQFHSEIGQCGKGQESPLHSVLRVIGGKVGSIEDWPWMVSMYSQLIKQPWCAGTLIADRWVVTAAHCFNGPFAMPSSWTLHFGKSNSSGAAEYEREQVRMIQKVFIHPSYNQLAKEFSFDGDIALVKLDQPVEFTDSASPMCLVRNSDDLTAAGVQCKITGYGISNLTNVHQGLNVLHVAEVPLIDKRTCAGLKGYGDKVTDNMICAGPEDGGVDTCRGDSGGPLQCKVSGEWHLVGVTSWGGRTYTECAEPGQPGVYTHVSRYTPWIYSQIYKDYTQQ